VKGGEKIKVAILKIPAQCIETIGSLDYVNTTDSTDDKWILITLKDWDREVDPIKENELVLVDDGITPDTWKLYVKSTLPMYLDETNLIIGRFTNINKEK
jgi:hypothetical protein